MRMRMRGGLLLRSIGFALLTLALAGAALADDTRGLRVGDTPPGFELTDQNGQTRSLASLLGSGKLAVVFFRSADW